MSAFDPIMFLAILAGTVHPHHQPVRHHQYVTAQHRHVAHKAPLTHVARLPAPRPTLANAPAATPMIVLPTVKWTPYPFVWRGKYKLPSAWLQVWASVG